MAGGGIGDVNRALGEPFGGDRSIDLKIPCGEGLVGACGRVCRFRGEGVDARNGGRWQVVECHQLEGGLRAEGFAPSVVEPIGMRVRDGWGQLGKIEERFFGRCCFAHDRIDQAPDRRFAEVDGFKHRGVVGKLQDEQLAEPDAQDVARLVVEFPFSQLTDPMVEQPAVAEDAENDGIQESSIRGR